MSEFRRKGWTYGLVSYACNVIATFSLFFFVLVWLPSFDPTLGTVTASGLVEARVGGLDLVGVTGTIDPEGDLPWWLDVLGRADRTLPLLCWGIGAYVLGEVVRSVQAGQPFDHRNPRRIVTLASLVAIGGAGAGLMHYLMSELLLARADIPDRLGVYGHFDMKPASLVIAGVLLVVAGAFRQGRKLTQDVEGLV